VSWAVSFDIVQFNKAFYHQVDINCVRHEGAYMKPALNALVLAENPQLVQTSAPLSCFDVQFTICRNSQTATDRVRTHKFDLLVADVDIEGGIRLVDMTITNDRGYRTTVIALASEFETVGHLLTKNVHFALRKPVTTGAMAQVLASACNLILIEKRTSFRHAVMINIDVWALKNGVKEALPNATCLDISQTGLRMRCRDAPAKGSTVFVDFCLPGSQEWIHTVGQLVWKDAHGQSGINFRYIPPREFKLLRDYLNARCPWPRLLSHMPECLRTSLAQNQSYEFPGGCSHTSRRP
jgi:hypothetical protein